jgi:hypothetical protein
VNQAEVMRHYLDGFGAWFPSQVRDKDTLGIVKRTLLDFFGEYPAETQDYAYRWPDACKAASHNRTEAIGAVLEEFKTIILCAIQAERKAKQLEPEPEADLPQYARRQVKGLLLFLSKKLSRGDWLRGVEAVAHENGVADGDVHAMLATASDRAGRSPGGLEGRYVGDPLLMSAATGIAAEIMREVDPTGVINLVANRAQRVLDVVARMRAAGIPQEQFVVRQREFEDLLAKEGANA